MRAVRECGLSQLVVAGGVGANLELRRQLIGTLGEHTGGEFEPGERVLDLVLAGLHLVDREHRGQRHVRALLGE